MVAIAAARPNNPNPMPTSAATPRMTSHSGLDSLPAASYALAGRSAASMKTKTWNSQTANPTRLSRLWNGLTKNGTAVLCSAAPAHAQATRHPAYARRLRETTDTAELTRGRPRPRGRERPPGCPPLDAVCHAERAGRPHPPKGRPALRSPAANRVGTSLAVTAPHLENVGGDEAARSRLRAASRPGSRAGAASSDGDARVERLADLLGGVLGGLLGRPGRALRRGARGLGAPHRGPRLALRGLRRRLAADRVDELLATHRQLVVHLHGLLVQRGGRGPHPLRQLLVLRLEVDEPARQLPLKLHDPGRQLLGLGLQRRDPLGDAPALTGQLLGQLARLLDDQVTHSGDDVQRLAVLPQASPALAHARAAHRGSFSPCPRRESCLGATGVAATVVVRRRRGVAAPSPAGSSRRDERRWCAPSWSRSSSWSSSWYAAAGCSPPRSCARRPPSAPLGLFPCRRPAGAPRPLRARAPPRQRALR